VLGDVVEGGFKIGPKGSGGQQFLLSVKVPTHDINDGCCLFLALLGVELYLRVGDLYDVVDILIANEEKLDIAEVLLVDVQFLVDDGVDFEEGALFIGEFLVVCVGGGVLSGLW
jgi:hypothetical protein